MSHCLNKYLTIFSLLTFYEPLFFSFPLYLALFCFTRPNTSSIPLSNRCRFHSTQRLGQAATALSPCTSSGDKV